MKGLKFDWLIVFMVMSKPSRRNDRKAFLVFWGCFMVALLQGYLNKVAVP